MSASPLTPSLSSLLSRAARAEHAYQLHAVLRDLLPKYHPRIAADIIGARWPILAGKRLTDSLLTRLITRTAKVESVGRAQACRIVGSAMMTGPERLRFGALLYSERLRLLRFTDLTHTTNWFRSLDVARAAWSATKPPLYSVEANVSLAQVLCVKGGGAETAFVLIPGTVRGWGDKMEDCK